jgi:hypothetical protein
MSNAMAFAVQVVKRRTEGGEIAQALPVNPTLRTAAEGDEPFTLVDEVQSVHKAIQPLLPYRTPAASSSRICTGTVACKCVSLTQGVLLAALRDLAGAFSADITLLSNLIGCSVEVVSENMLPIPLTKSLSEPVRALFQPSFVQGMSLLSTDLSGLSTDTAELLERLEIERLIESYLTRALSFTPTALGQVSFCEVPIVRALSTFVCGGVGSKTIALTLRLFRAAAERELLMVPVVTACDEIFASSHCDITGGLQAQGRCGYCLHSFKKFAYHDFRVNSATIPQLDSAYELRSIKST